MLVLRVRVWDVRVRVLHAFVPVSVGVGFARRIVRQVLVLMMFDMRVGVRMLHGLVNMVVVLGHMQPHADGHQKASRQ